MNVSALLGSFGQIGLTSAVNSEILQDLIPLPMLIGILTAGLIVSLLWCFFGLKLVRIWAAVFGLGIGAAVGAGAAAALNLNETAVLVAALAVGIILAVIGAALYHVGIFLVIWIAGTAISFMIARPQELTGILICAGIGLIFALLTLKFTAPITMVLTGILGAMSAASLISLLFIVLRVSASDMVYPEFFIGLEAQYQNIVIRIIITVVLAVLGIMVQFLLESGKRKRQNLRKAKEIREQTSTENEVEKARAMMEDLDVIGNDEDEYEIYDEELDDDDDI